MLRRLSTRASLGWSEEKEQIRKSAEARPVYDEYVYECIDGMLRLCSGGRTMM